MTIRDESEMEDRRVYRIQSRNLVVGVWSAKDKGFIGIREKFKTLYLFTEYHADSGGVHGTARAVSAYDLYVPDDIPLVEYLVDEEGDFLKDERGYLQNNDALFDLLKPLDEEIHVQLAEEWRLAQIETDSKRMAPQTREQWERAQRMVKLREWVEEQRAQGLTFHDYREEYLARYKKAQEESG